jgi:hypothetical protein
MVTPMARDLRDKECVIEQCVEYSSFLSAPLPVIKAVRISGGPGRE